jgi:hypothetical protein
MSQFLKPRPVKHIIGFIFSHQSALSKAQEILINKFGRIDFESRILDFDYTKYYQKEFGTGLKRKFISFKRLVSPQSLANIKVFANNLERALSKEQKRLVNIDPGYLDLARLVLATTKDYCHRVYLNKGIYAEVTLFFQNGKFSPGPWTYLDYQTAEYLSIFTQIRGIYAEQVASKK